MSLKMASNWMLVNVNLWMTQLVWCCLLLAGVHKLDMVIYHHVLRSLGALKTSSNLTPGISFNLVTIFNLYSNRKINTCSWKNGVHRKITFKTGNYLCYSIYLKWRCKNKWNDSKLFKHIFPFKINAIYVAESFIQVDSHSLFKENLYNSLLAPQNTTFHQIPRYAQNNLSKLVCVCDVCGIYRAYSMCGVIMC